MVTNQQVVILMREHDKHGNMSLAAAKAGMSRETGRRYCHLGVLPSQARRGHTWRTRTDPFGEVWEAAAEELRKSPTLEAKSLFEHLQGQYPGKFGDGQLRTFQRRVKIWRATEGPEKEVFFAQRHQPGQIGESDFTSMTEIGITVERLPFPHLLYHFVLTYSNWETGMVCFGESYESLSEGLQNALWELGGVPTGHRTDRLSAAVNKECRRAEFTQRYHGLLRHYGLQALATQAGHAHEKGDIEQRHHRIKRALDQALLLRGSRDFETRAAYESFLRGLFDRLNAGRQQRLREERAVLKPLPTRRLDDSKRFLVRVGPGSTIQVLHNTYSVNSRLLGEEVAVQVTAETLVVWYGQKPVEVIPRLRGENKHRINYRHIIDWLVRKPGAFAQYRYRQDLFPTTVFRMAYDQLRRQNAATADKRYLEILHVAAQESEAGVTQLLREQLDSGRISGSDEFRARLAENSPGSTVPAIRVEAVNLGLYDTFLKSHEEVESCRV